MLLVISTFYKRIFQCNIFTILIDTSYITSNSFSVEIFILCNMCVVFFSASISSFLPYHLLKSAFFFSRILFFFFCFDFNILIYKYIYRRWNKVVLIGLYDIRYEYLYTNVNNFFSSNEMFFFELVTVWSNWDLCNVKYNVLFPGFFISKYLWLIGRQVWLDSFQPLPIHSLLSPHILIKNGHLFPIRCLF